MHTHTYVHRYALNICYSLITQLQNAYDKSKTDDKVTEYLYLYVCVCVSVSDGRIHFLSLLPLSISKEMYMTFKELF